MPISSPIYSFPYLVYILYLVVLMFLEFRHINRNEDIRTIRWASLVGFVFFFGLRGFLHTDWQVYYQMFEKLPTLWDGGFGSAMSDDVTDTFQTDVSTGKSGVELGFIYFNVILKSIFPNYFAWVFVNTVIDALLLDIFFRRYSPYYVLSFILFFGLSGCGIEVNLMRNVKSILIFLISIKYIEERRILPYMLLNIVGFFFHTSALMFLPLYFILGKVWNKWLLWSFFGVGLLIMVFQIGFLQPILLIIGDIVGGRLSVLIKMYLASDLYNQSYDLGLSFLERIVTFILLVVFQNKLIKRNPRNTIFINAYVLYYIIFFYFTEILVVVERMTTLFVFSYWVIYPELLALVKQLYNKWLFVTTIVLYCCLKITSMYSNIFAKYDNLIFGIESYEVRKQIIDNNFENYKDGD